MALLLNSVDKTLLLVGGRCESFLDASEARGGAAMTVIEAARPRKIVVMCIMIAEW